MTNIGSSWDLRESLFPPPSHNCFGAVLIQRTLTFCLSWDYSRRSFSSCKWIFELPNCQVKNKIHKLRIIKGQIAAIIRFHSFLLFVYWTGVFTQHSCCSPALFLGNHAKFVWAVVVQSSGPKYPILTSMGPWQLMLCAAPARPGLPTRHDATLMAWGRSPLQVPQLLQKSIFHPWTSKSDKIHPSIFETMHIMSLTWLWAVLKAVLSFSFLFILAKYL